MITHKPGCVAAPFCGCAEAEIAALLSRAEAAEKRAEEAERERDEARAGYRCVDCDVVFTREGLRAHCEDDLSKARAVIASMRGAPCPRCAETEAALAAALAAQERGAAEANKWFVQAQREGRARIAAEAEVERLTTERDDAAACAQRVALGYKAEVERLRVALRECQQQLDDEGQPCWCCIPPMIPYRGHDAGCLAARSALREPETGGEAKP